MTKRSSLAAALVAVFATAGCTGLSNTEQRLLTGTTAGAASGAAIGAIAGNAALGAGIGAAAGLAGSALWDLHKQAEQQAFDQGVAVGSSGG